MYSLTNAFIEHTMKVVRFRAGIACNAAPSLVTRRFYFAYKSKTLPSN